jgi:hypothetical protein
MNSSGVRFKGTARPAVRWRMVWLLVLTGPGAFAQKDTLFRSVTLDEVVISAQASGFDVQEFIRQVRTDTTFHKAFLNTRYHPHRLRSELRVYNKGDHDRATLYRTGVFLRFDKQAILELDTVRETGRLRDGDGDHRYLTAEMYDEVFFPKEQFVANNTVAARKLEVERGSRFEKYKSELKKFMFDPGTEIATVPFIGEKLALFSPEMAPLYDFRIWSDVRNGTACWVFSAEAKPEFRDGRTVIKSMDTWFDQQGGSVMARNYRIASSSVVLDFDITIKVQNRLLDGTLVPLLVEYSGDWDIPFKKREIVRFYLAYRDWQLHP